jgi:class 3 adenylate cyclase
LLDRFRHILEWSPVDKCLVTAALVLSFGSWYILASYYYLAHPDAIPYGNLAVAQRVFPFAVVMVIGAWSAIALTGLAIRRRFPDSQFLVYLTTQLFAIDFSLAAWAFGTQTTLFTATVMLGGAAYGLILFDRRPALLAVVTYACILLGATIAEQVGLLPYAPLLVRAPFENGHLAGSWFLTVGGPNLVLLLAVAVLLYYVIDRWHESTEQLARANDLISRYVAAQVAEQIRLGRYNLVDRHERRKLTLFFSDIQGFSEFAEEVEPEDLSRILNEYLAEMTTIAERHGATIDKFVGDAIMIFFGAPVATDDRDHALRAVRMAIEMQRTIRQLRERWRGEGVREPFLVRMGINTGVASVGNFGSQGRLDYTAIGRQVNLAARLQVSCAPGSVLLSHSTWALVRDDITCVPKGEISVKGIHRPIHVYEVADMVDEAGSHGPPVARSIG